MSLNILFYCTVLENAWRVQDWVGMKETSTQAEPVCSEAYSSKLNLLRGFLALCYPDEQRLSAVEKLIEAASIQSIKQWRRLPRVVARAHVPLLQVLHVYTLLLYVVYIPYCSMGV